MYKNKNHNSKMNTKQNDDDNIFYRNIKYEGPSKKGLTKQDILNSGGHIRSISSYQRTGIYGHWEPDSD